MQKIKLFSLLAFVATGAGVPLHAQTPAADFNASSFNAANGTLTDSVNGIVATTANGGTNARASNGAITTTGAGFTFNADSVTGLLGLTSYTIAVGFTYNGGAGGGANAYQGQGAFGGDLPGTGQGDANLGITSDGGGQIIGSVGSNNGADNSVYDTSGSTFVLGAFNRAVLVVNGNTETLYVNGAPTTQGSPLTLGTGVTFSPFGYLNGVATTNYTFGIGRNTNATTANTPLNGSITDVQIYESALTATQAQGLTLGVPEPSTCAMVLGALGGLAVFSKLRRQFVD